MISHWRMALLMHSGNKVDIASLKKQLQKSFCVLKQCYKLLKDAEDATRPCIKTMVNLSEQYQCCNNVPVSSLPVSLDASEVQQKLLFKISTEINENISNVQREVYRLKDYSDRLGDQYDRCMSQYRRFSTTGEVFQLEERSALYPSVTDMLQWIETSERWFREIHLCKKLLVDTFTPDKPGMCDTLEKSWADGHTDLHNTLDLYMAATVHFLELKSSDLAGLYTAGRHVKISQKTHPTENTFY